jgi:peptide-methionine (S)-S-oxide reductase
MQKQTCLACAGIAGVVLLAALAMNGGLSSPVKNGPREPAEIPPGAARATFGAGCFWCTEAVFQQLKGVYAVISGYSGGHLQNPTYKQICTGLTGHAEVVQIAYDPAVLSYEDLLEVFWKTHDPTTLNQQGEDHGPQYRSAIFYHDDAQKKAAAESKRKLAAARFFSAPIVTEIVPFTEFFRAEQDHQDFYDANPQHGYCRVVIRPKLEKLREILRAK